jgi:hypothetical protein
VLENAPAKVRQGAARLHGLESLPVDAETHVRDDCVPPVEVNVAATFGAAFIVTEQPPVPLQAPVQPLKVQPIAGAALSVTCWPMAKLALHVGVQLMPEGVLVTVPFPDMKTASVEEAPDTKVADTDCAEFIVTTQLAVPLHAPPQPLKYEPEPAVAVSATCAPPAKLALHVDPQLIAEGELVTVPLPVSLTNNVKV